MKNRKLSKVWRQTYVGICLFSSTYYMLSIKMSSGKTTTYILCPQWFLGETGGRGQKCSKTQFRGWKQKLELRFTDTEKQPCRACLQRHVNGESRAGQVSHPAVTLRVSFINWNLPPSGWLLKRAFPAAEAPWPMSKRGVARVPGKYDVAWTRTREKDVERKGF